MNPKNPSSRVRAPSPAPVRPTPIPVPTEGIPIPAEGERVDSETFVRVWQTSKCTKEVAERVGCSVGSAAAKAARFRKMGVELKAFPRGRGLGRPDWESLKKLAKSLVQ